MDIRNKKEEHERLSKSLKWYKSKVYLIGLQIKEVLEEIKEAEQVLKLIEE